MDHPPDESLYYNAVAVALGGDYNKLARLRISSGTWRCGYENLLADGNLRVPGPQEAWENMHAAGILMVLLGDDDYPPLLKEIPDPPFGLYMRGTLSARTARSISIVGTRRATPEGRVIARKLAHDLADAGFVIVSGLALGIDAAAHEGCLDTQGITIAVLAGGLNSIYPREHDALAEKILSNGGAVISEYPFGAPPYSGRFLERNRIVSGLSAGVLIIEAPDRSGSLATARYASDQSRDLFVVPGPATHPNFFGSHQLIRQGATLVTKAEEILEAYGVKLSEIKTNAESRVSDEEKQILEALRRISAPADVDKISLMTKLEPRIVNSALAFLLIKNLVKETGAGYTI